MTDIDLSDLAADRDGSRKLRGYLASPAGTGPWPAVVMIHEMFGLDDVMRGHADRLAGFGYLTLAVDLFGAGSTARCLVTTLTALIRGHGRACAGAGECAAVPADQGGHRGDQASCGATRAEQVDGQGEVAKTGEAVGVAAHDIVQAEDLVDHHHAGPRTAARWAGQVAAKRPGAVAAGG